MDRTDLVRLARLSGVRMGRFALAVLLGATAVLAGVALLGLSASLICRASRQPPILSLGVAIVTVRVLAIAGPLARYGERLVGHDVAFRSLGRLRVAMFERIEPLAPGELDLYRDGDLLSRVVRDIDEIQDLVLRVLLPAAVALVVVPVVVIALTLLLPVAGLVTLIGLVVAAILPPALAHRVTRRTQRGQGALRARLTSDLVDALDGAEELWLCGATEGVERRLAESDAALAAAGRADARGAGWSDAVLTLLTGVTSVGVLVLAASAAHRGVLDPLAVAPLALVAAAAFEIVVPLTSAARSIDAVRAAGARVLELGSREPALRDPTMPVDPPGPRPVVTTTDLAVDRGYGDAARRALEGVTFTLGAGDRLLVVGPSGSGKSTLLLTLARFVERGGGEARLAGRDLRSFAQADVRHEVVLIEQDPHVFDSTIRENVALARPGSGDDDIRRALGHAQLGDFVASLPEGLDTRVGASGRALSGGQRQRLAMARAFLAEGSVLLVDEPTAHLDGDTAADLLDDLWAAAGDRSVLLASHDDPGPFGACGRVAVTPPAASAVLVEGSSGA